MNPNYCSRIALLALLLLGTVRLQGQDENSTSHDSILGSAGEEFIQDHKKQLNIKFEVSNDINAYSVESGGEELFLKPNLELRYALVFSYKFLSVRLGIRPAQSDLDLEKKGESDTFRLRVQALFDNWSHLIQYDYDRGYYLDNTLKFDPDAGAVKAQFPYMTTHLFFGSSIYKFNPNYSIRSIESQTEIQVKSSGSLVLGLNYGYYSLFGMDRVLKPGEDLSFRDPFSEFNGFNIAPLAGYYYTFVFKKYWFANAFVIPQFGIDIYKSTLFSEGQEFKKNRTEFFAAVDYGFGGGYNGEKFFFGAQLRNRRSSAKLDADKIQIQPQKNTFSVYLGYRFKAPKTVAKPVDLIEEKVPILKDNRG